MTNDHDVEVGPGFGIIKIKSTALHDGANEKGRLINGPDSRWIALQST